MDWPVYIIWLPPIATDLNLNVFIGCRSCMDLGVDEVLAWVHKKRGLIQLLYDGKVCISSL